MTQTNLPAYKAVLSDTDAQFGSWDPFVLGTVATPSENLSLLVTSGEVAMWRDRANNGPYRTVGDVDGANSPGHWQEMVESSTSDFTSWRWTGPTYIGGDGRVLKATEPKPGGGGDVSIGNDPPGSARLGATRLMDSAYVALVNDDAALAQSVIDEIVWHAGQTNLNFASRTLYPYDYYFDLPPLYGLAEWGLWLAQAYSAATVLGTPNATAESWLGGLADVCDNSLRSLDNEFPNRQNDDYTSRSSFVDTDTQASTRLADGSIVEHLRISRFYQNRRNHIAGVLGFVGLLTGDGSQVAWAKRYIREWMMFAGRTTPGQETFGDHNRGSDSFPQLPLVYDTVSLMSLLTFMEALARSGDTSLYDFTSSVGSAHPTWGSNHTKTMKDVLGQRIGWVAGTSTAQYTGSGAPPAASVAGNNFYRIKSRSEQSGNEIGGDGWLLAAAAYYNEPGWEDVVNRVGTPTGFTASPQSNGDLSGWRVDGRTRFLRSIDANPYGGA